MSSYLTIVFVYAAVAAALVPLFRFGSLRVRNEALPPAARDPQLGRKFVLCLFTHVCLMMILVGLTVSADDAIWYAVEPMQIAEDVREGGEGGRMLAVARPPKKWWNGQQRMAAALVLSGLIHGGLAWASLFFLTNQRRQPGVARSFVVLRFGLCGLLLLIGNTLALIMLLSEGKTDYRVLSVYFAVIGVWGPAMLGHLGWMLLAYRRRREEAVE